MNQYCSRRVKGHALPFAYGLESLLIVLLVSMIAWGAPLHVHSPNVVCPKYRLLGIIFEVVLQSALSWLCVRNHPLARIIIYSPFGLEAFL